MATKLITLIVLLIAAMATTFSTCKKGGLGCANAVYSFQIGGQAYPDADSIPFEDTIWIEINMSANLTDVSSNEVIDYSGAVNLSNALSFVKLIGGGSISNPGAIYAANEFEIDVIEGKRVNNAFDEGIREYLFVERENQYKLKLAVIPKQIGIYSIGLSNSVNVYRRADKCTKANFEIEFKDTNQHLYLLQSNRPGYTISDYERRHLYCFKVY